MGSPDFAVTSLKKIIGSRHTVVGVVTQPDKERGRGQKLIPTPVKQAAIVSSISPIFQPVSLKDEDFIERLRNLQADLFVVVAFRILPEQVFSIPPKGTINLHPSLLPKYRGAAPINWTIINGETESGVSIIRISKDIDAGNILLQKKMVVYPEETAGSLHDRLAESGAELLLEAIENISRNQLAPIPQQDQYATPAPKLTKELCHLSFDQPAEKVKNWIHGLSPYPAAFCLYRDKTLKIYRARVLDHESYQAAPGTVLKADEGELQIACKPGILQILELQREGKRRMSTEEFLRGQKISVGESFQ